MSDGQILSACQYKKDGKADISPQVPDKALTFANKVCYYLKYVTCWQPDPIFSLDIAKANGEYAILELNSFSCSGLYACDPLPIVRRVNQLARKEYEYEGY